MGVGRRGEESVGVDWSLVGGKGCEWLGKGWSG